MTRNDSIARAVRRALVLSAVVAASTAGAPAFAQDQDQAEQTVVVTGSRIVRQDYEANSPLTTVTKDNLVNNADVTLETALNNLPQIVAGGTTTSNNPPNGGQANIDLRGLGANRNLVLVDGRRPMVSANDLTVDLNTIPSALIDSVEVITGGGGAVYGADAVAGVVNLKLKNNFQGFDLSASLSNSSQYHDDEEYTVQALIGGNFDEGRGNAVLAFDRTSRESLVKSQRPFSVLATSTTGTPPQGVLRWSGKNAVPQPAVAALFTSYGIDPSLVQAQSGKLGFNRDGTLFYAGVFNNPTLNVQNFKDPIDSGVNSRFYPDFYSYNFDAVNLLQLPLHRTSLMSKLNYEFESGPEVFGNLSYTNYTAATALAPSPVPSVDTLNPNDCSATDVCSAQVAAGGDVSGSLVIPYSPGATSNNKYIPADLVKLLNARTGDDPNLVGSGANEAFLFGIRPVQMGLRQENYENTVVQYLGGVRGKIIDSWHYEASFSEGHTTINDVQQGNVQTQLLTNVLADPDGAVNGACADWNPFGTNPMPESCIKALGVKTATTLKMKQQVAQAFVTGDLFDAPAGTVSSVLGTEYRSFSYTFDPGSGAGPISGFNTQDPEGGNNQFVDFFGELLFPILKDAPGAKSLDIDVGYRYSKSQFRDTIHDISSETHHDGTYKVELSWAPVDDLRVRGSYQRAVRAPNFGELFQGGGSFPQIFDPCSVTSKARTGPNGAQVRQLCMDAGLIGGVPPANIDTFQGTPGAQAQIGTSGNVALTPEKANTYTLGVVFGVPSENRWLERLRTSIDYYNITVKDAILVPDVNTGIAGCFNYLGTNPTYSPDNPYCQALYRAGDILAIFNPNDPTGNGNFNGLNDGRIKTSGIDFQFDWGFDLNWLGLPDRAGAIKANLLLSRLIEYKLTDTPGEPEIDYAGTINYFGGGISLGQTLPTWRAVLTTNWTISDFDLLVRGRWIDKMENRANRQYIGETSFTGVGSVTYWDLSAAWHFMEKSELRIGLNNATNKQPPTYAPNIQSGTDPATYDIIGRRWFVRMETRF